MNKTIFMPIHTPTPVTKENQPFRGNKIPVVKEPATKTTHKASKTAENM